jgi:hypothetical protein
MVPEVCRLFCGKLSSPGYLAFQAIAGDHPGAEPTTGSISRIHAILLRPRHANTVFNELYLEPENLDCREI